MTKELKYLMHLLAAGACGGEVNAPDCEIDWQRLVKLSNTQGIMCILADVLSKNPSLPCPEEIKNALINSAKKFALAGFVRNGEAVKLLSEMEKAGISATLLKGISIARFYAKPMYRISSDTDVLISPKDEKKAIKFLEDYGFRVQKRWKHENHAECNHPRIGLLELHTLLYEEMVEEIWFNNTDGNEFVREPRKLVKSPDGEFYSLGDTDCLIFTTLHMIKHFITGVITLRMMMDIALFFKKNAESIDTARYWETLEKLKYRKLVENILWAMISYCGFKAEDFPGICENCPEEVDEILSDLEAGGLHASREIKEREDSWIEYNRKKILQNSTPTQYKIYMIKWRLGLLFPPRAVLEEKYPYTKKLPVLIPIAWLHRLFTRGLKRISGSEKMLSEKGKISKEATERVELFSKLDMM